VHDWSERVAAGGRAWDTTRPPGPVTASAKAAHQDAIEKAYESSPISSVRTWRSPVLLIHGDDDRNVDFSQTIDLAAALRKQGVYFEQLVIPDEIHMFLRHDSWLRAYRAEIDFLRRKL
jgi:dipeptidyl aminopeptidase/acylaminoacyl peptidase